MAPVLTAGYSSGIATAASLRKRLPADAAGSRRRVFTHRLNTLEAEHDLLEFGPDLAPVSLLTEDETYQSLVDGSAIFDAMPGADDEVLAERGVPVNELGVDGGWLLEPGHFAALGVGVGDVVGLRVTDAGFKLIAVAETTESPIGSRL